MGGVSRIFMQHHPATFREFPKAVMPRALTLPERRADETIGSIDDSFVCSAAEPICISGSSNYLMGPCSTFAVHPNLYSRIFIST